MGIRVRQNRSLISASIKASEEGIEDELQERVLEMAEYLVRISPVWSGAYVTSHSFGPPGFGGGRSRTSRTEDGPVSKAAADTEALNLLYGDIMGVDFLETKGGTFRNRSPHASTVEWQGTKNNPQGWFVYSRLANKYG